MSAEEHVQKASAHDSAGAVDPKVSRNGCDSLSPADSYWLACSFRPATPSRTTTPPVRPLSSTEKRVPTTGQSCVCETSDTACETNTN